MPTRTKSDQEATSKMLESLAHLAAHLSVDQLAWEHLLQDAREALELLTRTALLNSDLKAGIDTTGYYLRAQELNIRLEILEEFSAQLPNPTTED